MQLENIEIEFPINSRVKIDNSVGTVKYYGEVVPYPGTWVGVEWDDPSRGKHNGAVNGVQYFQTKHSTAGSMVRPTKLMKNKTVQEAFIDRYQSTAESHILDEALMREAQKSLNAALFEVIGMEKIGLKLNNFGDIKDVSIARSPVNAAGDLSAFKTLRILDLTDTLVWSWRIVAEIVEQLPQLEYINLSCTILMPPKDMEEILELEPKFRHLKEINLRHSGLKSFDEVLWIAQLWPNLTDLSLQDNEIETLAVPDCSKVFRNMRKLDLHDNCIKDFKEVMKLADCKTLETLHLRGNGLDRIEFPYCPFDEKLPIFQSLIEISLISNPVKDENFALNELDKLPSLTCLSLTPSTAGGYEDMYYSAAAMIEGIKKINRIVITREERQGAEYDLWKKHALEYLAYEKDAIQMEALFQRCRAYPRLIRKHGSPEVISSPAPKISNLIQIAIHDKSSGKIIKKKLPRLMLVQALHGLVLKLFSPPDNIGGLIPKLSYRDAKKPELHVLLDCLSKSLDYYSIQDQDVVLVEWN